MTRLIIIGKNSELPRDAAQQLMRGASRDNLIHAGRKFPSLSDPQCAAPLTSSHSRQKRDSAAGGPGCSLHGPGGGASNPAVRLAGDNKGDVRRRSQIDSIPFTPETERHPSVPRSVAWDILEIAAMIACFLIVIWISAALQ